MQAPRTHPSPPREDEASALRRQLEGRLECLESASRREATLCALLRSWRWKARLRAHPALLQEVRSAEPAVMDARATVQRRAEREHGPAADVAREHLSRFDASRHALEKALRARLRALHAPMEREDLAGALTTLERLVREPAAPPLRPGERILLEGELPGLPSWVAWAGAVTPCVLLPPLLDVVQPSLALLGGFALNVLLFSLRSAGRFALTPERLLWTPRWRPAVQLLLASIPPEGIRLDARRRTLEVRGTQQVRLRPRKAEQLALLLSLHRHVQACGGAASPSRVATLALCPGRRERTGTEGVVLLRPRSVAFLPAGSGARALEHLSGAPPPVPIPERLLLETLALLPEAQLDAQVEAAVRAAGGLLWPAEQAVLVEDPASNSAAGWGRMEFALGEERLVGLLDFESFPAARQLLSLYWRG